MKNSKRASYSIRRKVYQANDVMEWCVNERGGLNKLTHTCTCSTIHVLYMCVYMSLGHVSR